MMENKIRRALDNDQFKICFQPRVNLKSRKIESVEALIHWKDSEDKVFTSREFTPLAEDTGLIVPMGRWLIKQACQQNKIWMESGLPPITIVVNISSRLLKQPDFSRLVSNELKLSGLDARYLELELREGTLPDVILSTSSLNTFHAMGIKISIADFGTGFTSLRYLKSLPIYKIKIDHAFISGIEKNKSDREIIKAIVSMAHSMNIKVVGEGVETQNQFDFLAANGCDEGQGFFLSPPISQDDIFAMLNDIKPSQLGNVWEILGQTS
jgi:EAL domain-containing protein (putative c-di-GMP-specific phosphodiesterase class I)